MHIETLPGDGPDLLMLHGWAMHGGVFAPLCAALAGRYRVHLVDLPGHGYSRASDTPLRLPECAQQIAAQVPSAIWLGWSLGGLIALHAAHGQANARAVVMLCASPRFVHAEDWPYGVSMRVFREFGEGLQRDWHATIDRFLALETHGSEHMREALRNLRTAVFAHGEPAPRVLAEGMHLLEHSDLREVLPDLRVPSLWLAGRRDRLVDWRAVQQAAERTPGARFERIDGAAHAPFLTHTEAVAAALDDFIRHIPA